MTAVSGSRTANGTQIGTAVVNIDSSTATTTPTSSDGGHDHHGTRSRSAYGPGVVVVRVDGSALRPRHALVRLAGMLIGLPLLCGYVPILVNQKRRALHDAMAGTVVVESSLDQEKGIR